MLITRIQHMCDMEHGPVYAGDCNQQGDSYSNRPAYGTRLEAPQGDCLLTCSMASDKPFWVNPANRDCVIGTLPTQFDRWWSYGEPTDMLNGLWFICVYDVPKAHVKVGTNQVLFHKSKATLVGKTQIVEDVPNLVKAILKSNDSLTISSYSDEEFEVEMLENLKDETKRINVTTTVVREQTVSINATDLVDRYALEGVDTVILEIVLPFGRSKKVRIKKDDLTCF